MSKQIEMLKNQCEIDNQELKKKVLEQNEECKRLNNKLQEAKVLFQNYSNMFIRVIAIMCFQVIKGLKY